MSEPKSIGEVLKIGRFKYGALKGTSEENLTEEEKTQMQLYEEAKGINHVFVPKKPDPINYIDGVELNTKTLYKAFKAYYKALNGKDFIQTQDAIMNIEPIIKYFTNDPTFANSFRVIKQFNGKQIEPSLNKGLLIIGLPGNGKTSIMNTICNVFSNVTQEAKENHWKSARQWNDKRFLWKSCVEAVMEFESLEEAFEKDNFFKTYSGYRYLFDDLNRESVASNFGKRDIFKDILFMRYQNAARTYVTMNYPENPNFHTVEATLTMLGARYGSHIYDRMFEMFNIVEFKGPSMR